MFLLEKAVQYLLFWIVLMVVGVIMDIFIAATNAQQKISNPAEMELNVEKPLAQK